MLDTAYTQNYPYIYRGVVESNEDPDKLGRCRIRVPFIHGELTTSADSLPWARPIAGSTISQGRGSVNIPDTGDIVWVMFEGADKKFPVYLGGTYATGEIEADPNTVDFYLEGDNKFSYNRSEESYTINIGTSKIYVTTEGIFITGDTSIEGDLKVEGDVTVIGDVDITGDVSIQGEVDITGNVGIAGDVSIQGEVDITGNVNTTGNVTTSGNTTIGGSLQVSGGANISGVTTVTNLVITGTCNRECNCNHE